MADEDAQNVLSEYTKKFGRLPNQPHHLITFSKLRPDLPNLNYHSAKGIIDMDIAQAKPLPSPPKQVVNKQQKQNVIPADHAKEGLLSEDDEEDDALYIDGEPTTAPGFVAQLAMQANVIANADEFDYISPHSPDEDAANAAPKAKLNIHSLRDWCLDNGLMDIYYKLVSAGYTTCKMLSKCRDEQIDAISKDLAFTTPQELTFKVAVEELRTLYLENNYQLRHPEEHRSLTDIISKIKDSEALMIKFHGKMQYMHNEIYSYQMDVEREFQTMIEQLHKRKMVLINDLNKFFIKKKSIITMKQQTLTAFITEAKLQKNNIFSMLQDGGIDYTQIEQRKRKVIALHDDIIVGFLNVKKVEYGGLPKVNTSFPTTHNLLAEISRFGTVSENIQNTLGVMPVITMINHSGKSTVIKIKWELTNDHYGIDADTVKSIRIEWIEVDEQELQNELQSAMFMDGMVARNSRHVPGDVYRSKSMANYDISMQQQDDSKQMEQINDMNAMPVPVAVDHSGYIDKMESDLMNFAVIQPLRPEVAEEQKKNIKIFKQNNKKKKLTLNRWMSKHFDFSLYKAIHNMHEINVRKYGKFLVRIKLLGSEQALTTNYVQSNVFSIKVQKMGFNYIKDKWDPRTKHKDLRIGLVNKKILTRAVPGKWRNCFGSIAVSAGVNIWKILLKKMDSNRRAFSCMIGVMDSNFTGYMDTNFTEVGGYGMYMNNGNIFHNKKTGMKYYDANKDKALRPAKVGDVISVIVDYYRGTLSFKINKYDCGAAWSNINKFAKYKLCISLRGCDEVKILDIGAGHKTDSDEKYSKIGANIARKQKFVNKHNKKNRNRNKKNKKVDLNLGIMEAQDLSLNVDVNAFPKPALGSGSKSVGNSPYKRVNCDDVESDHDNDSKQDSNTFSKYKISAKQIRKTSSEIFDKIRRHSANSSRIREDMNGINVKKIKKVENPKMKKSKHYKQTKSFNFLKKSKEKKEQELKNKSLKNLNDESDEEKLVSLGSNHSDVDAVSFDISQLAAIFDENSVIVPSEMSFDAVEIEQNVLL